jgi:lipopolysaccharide/colanic/teichoic acid biosynthesis glycosyltransferase
MDRHWRYLRAGVTAGDVVAVIAAYALAAGTRFGFGEIRFAGILWPVYPLLAVAVAVLTVVLGGQLGIYRSWALFGGHRVYPVIATIATYGVLIVIVLSYFGGGPPLVSRGWLVTAWVSAITCLSASRLLWRQVALWWRRRGYLVRKVLIAGANQQGIAVAQQLHNPRRHGTLVLGFLDDYQRPGTEIVAGLTVVGHPANVLEQAAALGADEVIIIGGGLAWESQRLLAELVTRPDSPITARISPTFYDLLTTSAELSHIAYVPMLSLNYTRLSGVNGVVKGVMDRLGAGVLLALLLPGWLYWLIKAWVRGIPMLERRPVLGGKGRPFHVVGLDRRLTSSPVVARLPALWNVLWHDLSLVGPRPMLLDELRAHEPWLANLCAMRPGVTGLWRLRGRELPVEERVALDLFYIRNYTVTLDVQILVETARALARRVLGREDGLARWEEPPAGPGAIAGTAPVADGAIPLTEPAVQEHRTPSVWSRP